MKKGAWKNRIKKHMQAVGTFRDAFIPIIDTLAQILEERDKVYERYISEGAEAVVEYTNKNGSTNKNKNPLLVTWNGLNATALNYWRDLGLTPAGLRKIDESALKAKSNVSLGDIINSLGG